MSPFSLVLTSPGEHGIPVEIFALQDSRQASRREVQLSFALPPTTYDAQPQQHVDDPLVTTRFSGSFAYDVKYTGKEREKTHQEHTTSAPPGLAQASEPDLSTNEDGDVVSSASTTVLDLNREFERDADTDTEPAPGSKSDLHQLVEFGPPPRRRPPFREFQFDSDSDLETEMEALPGGDAEEFVERNSPLHRQPPSLASLTQVPTLPPRFRKLYAGAAASNIPMRVFDQGAESLNSARKQSSESECESEGRQPEAPTPPRATESSSGGLTSVLEIFHSIWRQLRQVGTLMLRKCTKNL